MKLSIFPIAASILVLSGCPNSNSDSHNEPVIKTYTITVSNLTNNQPLSPITAIVHSNNYNLYTIGNPASASLEKLAESGDNSEYLAIKDNNDNVYDAVSGSGIIAPGNSESVSITSPNELAYLSIASMLVNTNDAFIAERSQKISTLVKGDSITLMLNVFDSGTEANSETATTIPGPAGGGEGFNEQRNDTNNQITVHAGVVTATDGLTTSTLNATHRFTNPAAKLTITRSN